MVKNYLIVLVLLVAGCGPVGDGSWGDDTWNEPDTTLTIVNQSGGELNFIKWHDSSGQVYYFDCDYTGQSDTQSVRPGSGPIYFRLAGDPDFTQYWTGETIYVSEYSQVTFVFTGSTMIAWGNSLLTENGGETVSGISQKL